MSLVMCGYRVDVGGLGDPRPRIVEKARWRMLAGSGRNRPNICAVYSHPASVSSANPLVIHIRHNGSSIIAYRQIACSQGMCYR